MVIGGSGGWGPAGRQAGAAPSVGRPRLRGSSPGGCGGRSRLRPQPPGARPPFDPGGSGGYPRPRAWAPGVADRDASEEARTMLRLLAAAPISALLPLLLAIPAHGDEPKAGGRPRARDLGIPFEGTSGPLDAITDVRGVEVGHTTLISGEGKLV